MDTRLEGFAFAVIPCVFGGVTAFGKDLFRVSILLFSGKIIASLEEENLLAAGG